MLTANDGDLARVSLLYGRHMENGADAFEESKSIYEKPTMIIAHTIPGKGVKEFERDFHWHGKPPNAEQAEMALNELRTLGCRIRSEHQ